MHAWILLSQCYFYLHMYDESLDAAKKADQFLLSINNCNKALRKVLDKLLPDVMSRTTNINYWKEAINICLNVCINVFLKMCSCFYIFSTSKHKMNFYQF